MFNLRLSLRATAIMLGLLSLATALNPALATDNTYVRFNTSLGNIDVLLFSDEAPNTVSNFLTLCNASGLAGYSNTIIHRAVIIPATQTTPAIPFVIQGGVFYDTYDTTGTGSSETMFLPTISPVRDYTTDPLDGENMPTNTAYINAGISNTRGTIAMALSANQTTGITDPNSGSTSWFFNEVDNNNSTAPANLDAEGFTVFGKIINTSSLSVMDQIGNLPEYNVDVATSNGSGGLETTPLASNQGVELNGTIYPVLSDYVTVISITPLTNVEAFSDWQTGANSPFTSTQQSNPNFIAAAATPFNDGVPNLLKYVCDINPSVPMTGATRANLPTEGTITISGTKYLTLTYHQHNALVGVNVNVQTSPDLKTWTTAANPVFVQTGTDSNNDPILQVRVAATGTVQFIRLNVVQP